MVLFFTIILWISAIKYDKIYYGTYVSGVNIGGLTIEEAEIKITEEIKSRVPIVTLRISETEFKIKTSDYAKYDAWKTAKNAYKNGKNNYFSKFANFITPFTKKDVTLVVYVNTTKVTKLLNDFKTETDIPYKENSYEIKDEFLNIYTGHSGRTTDAEKMYNDVSENLKKFETSTISIKQKHIKYDGVNIEKIRKEIYKSPQNASVDYESNKVINPEDGIDFDVEQAKKIFDDSKEDSSYKIKLIITKPKITLETLSDEVFKETFASYSTNFDKSNINRSTNIKLAVSKINGKIILSGEIFSYNDTVGNRTLSAGFKSAPVYEGNRIIDGIGGGICQVSSTLYNAVLYSGLEILERTNHSLPVSYVPKGQDATVAWDSIDFKFKNCFDFPIKVVASANNGILTVSFKGFKKNDYEIKITNETTTAIPFKTSYKEDKNLSPNETKTIQKGSNGSKITSTRRFIKNGIIIKTEVLPSSTYMPTDEIIAINPNEEGL